MPTPWPFGRLLLASALLGGCASPGAPSAPTLASASAEASRDSPASPSTSAPDTPTGGPSSSASPAVLTSEVLREAVELADIRGHLEAFQDIADANGGSRATGTTGFDATVAYVEDRLADAGYEVERQLFIAGDVSS